MRLPIPIWCIVIVVVVSVADLAQAGAILTTADGNGADTYLSNDGQSASEGPDGTHGSAGSLVVRNFAGTRMKMAYVRFDLTGVEGDLSNAVLAYDILSTGNRDRTWDVYGLNDGVTGEDWSEATTSYNNAPGVIPNPPTELAQFDIDETEITLLGTIGMIGSGAQVLRSDNSEADTSLNLNAFLVADTNDLVTFLLINNTSDSNASYSIAGKENTTAGVLFPTLELPNAIPEPASLSLLALAGAGLLRRHRQ